MLSDSEQLPKMTITTPKLIMNSVNGIELLKWAQRAHKNAILNDVIHM